MSVIEHCNWCGKECQKNQRSRFCSRKCRVAKIQAHQIKGAKKRRENHYYLGAAFDHEGNSI